MLAEIRFGQHSMDKINEIFKDTNKINEFNNELPFEKNINSLEIKNLTYNYPGEKNLFENLNIILMPGDILGIAGPSGIGKTTLVDLMSNLIKPTKGEILINEKVLDNTNIKLKISYMTQDIFFINDTILKNITLEEKVEEIDYTKFKYSLEISKSINFINNLKFKEKTILGENGLLLSGGQKQKINFARAIYNESNLLILDEFTSSLDEKSEIELMEMLSQLHDKIIVIISHKKKLIKKYCNKILDLDN